MEEMVQRGRRQQAGSLTGAKTLLPGGDLSEPPPLPWYTINKYKRKATQNHDTEEKHKQTTTSCQLAASQSHHRVTKRSVPTRNFRVLLCSLVMSVCLEEKEPQPINGCTCRRMETFVNSCRLLQLDSCRRLKTLVDCCRQMQTHVDTCRQMQ